MSWGFLFIPCVAFFSRSGGGSSLKELPVTKAVIYRSMDKKAWKYIVREHLGTKLVVVVEKSGT